MAELLLTVPEIIGFAKFYSSSTWTVIVKMGVLGIWTRMVTVMVELSGMRGKPEMRTPLVE